MTQRRTQQSVLSSVTIRKWAYAQLDSAVGRDLAGREDGLSSLPPMAVQVILHDEMMDKLDDQGQKLDTLVNTLNDGHNTNSPPRTRAKEIVFTIGTKGGSWAIATGLITLAAALIQSL